MPVASFARLVGAKVASIVDGKAVWKAHLASRPTTYLFFMFSGRSRSILVTNSQSNMATHHLQTYARAMDSVIHVVRMAWKSNTGMEIGAAGWLANTVRQFSVQTCGNYA